MGGWLIGWRAGGTGLRGLSHTDAPEHPPEPGICRGRFDTGPRLLQWLRGQQSLVQQPVASASRPMSRFAFCLLCT